MAVVSSTINRAGWTGSMTNGGVTSYTVDWLVQCDDVNDGPLTAMYGARTASPNPILDFEDKYAVGNDTDNGVYCTNRSVALHAYATAGPIWLITETFTTPTGGVGGTSLTNPLSRPVKYHVEWANYTKLVLKDINDNPIVNSAGQPFVDPIEQDDQRPVLVATYNVPTLMQVVSLGMAYKNAVNTNSFWGAAPRHAKVQSITAGELQEENNVQFYTISIRVEFSDKAWDRQFIDQGMKYLDANGKLKAADDENGVPTGEPVLLAANGTKLPTGTTGLFKTFRTYPERDFSALGI